MVKLNTGLKVSALFQFAQTETMRMTRLRSGFGVAGEARRILGSARLDMMRTQKYIRVG